MVPVVVFKGGLGNQLFQWSYAHTLPLGGSFYPSRFHYVQNDRIRNFELEDIFSSCPHILNSGSYSRSRDLLGRTGEWMWNKRYLRSMTESVLGYYQEDPRRDVRQAEKIPHKVKIVSGYFQKNQYVDSSYSAVNLEVLPYAKKIATGLIDKNVIPQHYSVVHIRTGDYSAQSSSDPISIGQLSERYFLENLDKLKARYLIVLTETANHIPGLLKKIQPDLVLDANELDAWETLSTMSLCESMIGSNSSLSWWGAKLATINGGETWIPSNWSFWNNINSSDYRFPNVHTLEPSWRI